MDLFNHCSECTNKICLLNYEIAIIALDALEQNINFDPSSLEAQSILNDLLTKLGNIGCRLTAQSINANLDFVKRQNI